VRARLKQGGTRHTIFVGTLSLGKQPVSPVDAAKSVVTQLEANAAFPATFPATTLASGDKTA